MAKKEDLEFLSDLQQELKTQEIDSQAAPRFWVVRQWERKVTDSSFADGVVLIDIEGGEHIDFYDDCNMQDFVNHMKEHRPEDWENIDTNYGYHEMADLIEIIMENECLDDFIIYSYEEVPVIKENTMFLTKQEAKDHIKSNYYHYNNSVHTYAMTAWRAPKVERLLKILETFDFSE